jgi:hypothetical protein
MSICHATIRWAEKSENSKIFKIVNFNTANLMGIVKNSWGKIFHHDADASI